MDDSMEKSISNLKTELPYGPAFPLLGIYPEKTTIQRRYKHLNVHNSTIYNSQDMKTTKSSTDRSLDKDVVCTHACTH